MTSPASAENDSPVLKGLSKHSTRLALVLSVLLIILGVLAILLPVEMSFGVVIVVCWLLMISGLMQFIDAFKGTGAWQIIWKVAVATAYFVTGLYIRFNIGTGLAALTLALIAFFTIQGLINIFIYFRVRRRGAFGSLLLHGIVSLLLGVMIWRHWPSGSLWVIGTLVGINMIMTGTTRLMLALAIRRATRVIPQEAP